MQICDNSADKLVTQFESPVFVYNQDTITQKCQNLLNGLKAFKTKTKALYACKANTNPHVLRAILNAGITGIDTVSVQECMLALQCGFKKEDILYTENYISDQELQYAIDNKVLINVGELNTLEKIGQKYPNTEVAIRINPDIGSGENSHVITGGSESKFGIYFTQFQEVLDIVNKYNIKIVGVHQHIGSNICQQDIDKYINSAKCIFETSLHFLEHLKFINIGGGIGVPYKTGDESMNLYEAYEKIAELYQKTFREKAGKDVEIWCEPGRYLVADSGYLLCTATAIKTNPFYTYIGTDTGMNHLIRPAFYGSHHEIENASNFDSQKTMKSTICGNICESSDIFGKDRMIQQTKEGDILAICNAGAYCFSMANNYNSRFKPAEVLLSKSFKEPLLIRRRENYQDIMQTVVNF